MKLVPDFLQVIAMTLKVFLREALRQDWHHQSAQRVSERCVIELVLLCCFCPCGMTCQLCQMILS